MTDALRNAAIPIETPLPPEPPELIPGLLPRRGQLVIAGETEVGKTLVALEVLSALLTGGKLWGHLDVEPVKRVLYVLGEHYAGVVQRLWLQARLIAPPESLWLLSPEKFPNRWLVAAGRVQEEPIRRLRTWCQDMDAVVFDPLSAFVVGVDAENDNAAMRTVIDVMTRVTQEAKASCVILAHKGKPGLEKGREINRQSYAIRGASAIEDAATNIFYLEREGKDSDIFQLRRRKYKGEAPEEYILVRHHLRHTMVPLGKKARIAEKRIKFLAKLAEFQHSCPELTQTRAIEVLAKLEGVGERTVWRWLAGEEEQI